MTHRHTTPAVATTWTVVADRCTARILVSDTGDGDDMRELTSLSHPEGSLPTSQRVSDRQGYFGGREGSLEAGDPKTDFAHKSAMEFAAEIIDELEAGRHKQQFGQLNIIAAPMFLGVLRNKFPEPLARMITLEIDKDYTACTPSEVATNVAKQKGRKA